MKKSILFLNFLILIVFTNINAQSSTSDNLVIQPNTNRTVVYDVNATGETKTLVWGLDTAWASLENMKRGIAFMGADNVDVVRVSYFTHQPLVNGELHPDIKVLIDKRLGYIDLFGRPMQLTMNSVRNSVDPSYGTDGNYNPVTWAANIAATINYYEAAGHEVISISPCNECDLGTDYGNGDMPFNAALNQELRTLPELDGIRISSSTLNTDQALPWYNYLKATLDEGNTHQLAGSFNNYATFFQTVRADGNYASNDEVHNVIESIVGLEHGMQMGIWWGTPEYAGGEFVRASEGVKLGYSEHRSNWTSAAVYKNLEGKVQAFIGASERQATTTTYKFRSKDRPVYYDGYGPQREYVMEITGGTGYLENQPNAERVINIQWGDDIQPAISGMYKLVNRESGKVIQVANGSANDGANLELGTDAGQTYQQWEMTRVPSTIGGDFTFYKIGLGSNTDKKIAVDGSTLENDGNVISYANSDGFNRQWYLEYAEDGWFYIGSRQSGKYLDAASTSESANIRQWEKTGNTNQQWRFLPTNAPVEFNAPSAPTNLVATANSESIQLDWTASPDSDVAGYTIFRAESTTGEYSTIARYITTTSFVDNTTNDATYFYKIKAVDNSLNSSSYTSEVSATATGANGLVTHLQFEQNTLDSSVNLNHSASTGNISFDTGKADLNSIVLNGSDTFLQLPADVANLQEITISTWIYWNGGNAWQRIFDFGNNQSQFIYMTPMAGSTGNLRFGINNGNGQQNLNASAPLAIGEWSHVAVTLGATGGSLYINGVLVDESTTVTASPLDFKPTLNYIGKSHYNDPLLNGRIDDFKIYNYSLAPEEIANISNPVIVSEGIKAFRSFNFPDYYITHTSINGGSKIEYNADSPFVSNKLNAQFNIVKGLADENGVSFESVDAPGYYLSHQNFILKLRSGDDQDYEAFKNTATFYPREGLADSDLVSFESKDWPNYFIRHQNYNLRISNYTDSNVYRNDATFEVLEQLNNVASRNATKNKKISIEDCNGDCTERFSIWPMPVNNLLNIKYYNNENNKTSANIELFNINGRLLLSKKFINIKNAELNVSNIPSGVYILKLNNNQQISIRKIIVKH
ncbi:hypothetical protein BW723_06275 [Polaribacter reichenbachii]|uniref:Fibronectin type-III domain-containing protein n=1 Tax=Polaribacter reichenbachii TaxID=996801 RepID=A0A1B8U690_9FLAO|nr:AbfB domain-containing protein [Polaribacter reichenbachii]APZ45923.1 hypothetical protein BW723_06275 [Polaribacter reichenbachii]AUC19785.1 hypothetical protein BTO17_14295 [Polaribacter reichenbachii]OBY67362.1 hypothetical protein LPB301_03215 [Polaribacter reichenbachii]